MRSVVTPAPRHQARESRVGWAQLALAVGAGLVGLFAVLVLAQSVVLLCGGRIHPATTVGALVLTLAGLWLALDGWPRARRLLAVGALVAIVAVAVGVSAVTTDVSWDGNTYHKTAVGALRNGWNPVWQSIVDFNSGPHNPLVVPDAYPLWNDSYPKASWIFGASVYQTTGTIEAGKAFTLLLIVALFLLAAGYLTQRLGPRRGLVAAALLAANPVAVNQVFSYYVDGALGCLLISLMLLLTMLIDRSWDPPAAWRRLSWPTVAATMILLANLKFTGLLYAGIAGVVYLAVLAVRPARDRRRINSLAVVGAGSAVLAVGVVGASSYVRNLVTRHNPLYPLVGPGHVDILTSNEPAGFEHKNPIVKFVWANLSPSNGQAGPDSGPLEPLKVPFTFHLDELRVFADAAVRLGGYGVWFGGILLVSAVVGAWLLGRRARARGYLPLFLAPVAVTAIGVLAVDGSWWARYTPHLWVVPVLVVIGLWSVPPSGSASVGSRLARGLPWILVGAMALNTLSIFAAQAGLQVKYWRATSIADEVDRAGACGVYAATLSAAKPEPFSGALYDFVKARPQLRVLTTEEFESYPADAFVPATAGPTYATDGAILLLTRC